MWLRVRERQDAAIQSHDLDAFGAAHREFIQISAQITRILQSFNSTRQVP
jgi:hypothetical protein